MRCVVGGAVIDCGSVPSPPNGDVTLSGTMFSSVANYSCKVGYTLSGDVSRTCQANGMWSNTEPSCTGKQERERERCERKRTPVLFAAVIDCGALESPVHGQVKARETKFHSVATYSCNVGFVLTGDEIRICIETGHWSGSAPACTSK